MEFTFILVHPIWRRTALKGQSQCQLFTADHCRRFYRLCRGQAIQTAEWNRFTKSPNCEGCPGTSDSR